jgi:hypothetical protein
MNVRAMMPILVAVVRPAQTACKVFHVIQSSLTDSRERLQLKLLLEIQLKLKRLYPPLQRKCLTPKHRNLPRVSSEVDQACAHKNTNEVVAE